MPQTTKLNLGSSVFGSGFSRSVDKFRTSTNVVDERPTGASQVGEYLGFQGVADKLTNDLKDYMARKVDPEKAIEITNKNRK